MTRNGAISAAVSTYLNVTGGRGKQGHRNNDWPKEGADRGACAGIKVHVIGGENKIHPVLRAAGNVMRWSVPAKFFGEVGIPVPNTESDGLPSLELSISFGGSGLEETAHLEDVHVRGVGCRAVSASGCGLVRHGGRIGMRPRSSPLIGRKSVVVILAAVGTDSVSVGMTIMYRKGERNNNLSGQNQMVCWYNACA